MIVLKILLIILLAVLGLILLVLILPVGGEVSFIGGKLKFKVNLWVINVMDSESGGILGWLKKRKKKPSSGKKPKKPKKPKKKKSGNTEISPDIVYDIPPAEEISGQAADSFTETAVSENIPAQEQSPAAEESSADGQAQTGFYTAGDDADEPEADASPDEKADEPAADEDKDEPDKKKKKKKKDKDSDEKKSLSDIVDMLLDIWGSAKNPLCLIFKAFKFSDLYIDFIIANEDAYKCALNYGRISATTYRGIALMSRIFTVKLKTVDVQPAFGLKKGRFDAALKLHFRVGTFVIAGLWFLVTYIFRVFIPGKFRKFRMKKSAAAQK